MEKMGIEVEMWESSSRICLSILSIFIHALYRTCSMQTEDNFKLDQACKGLLKI